MSMTINCLELYIVLILIIIYQIHILIYLKFCVDGLIQMGYHEGVPSVWAGTVPSLVLVSQPTIKFTIYEFLKRYYLQLYGKLNLAAYSYYDSRNSIHKNLCDGINMNQFYNHLFIQQTNWHLWSLINLYQEQKLFLLVHWQMQSLP